MSEELKQFEYKDDTAVAQPQSRQEKKRARELLEKIDIAQIGAEAFRFNLKQKGNIIFSTSIMEIERIISDKKDRPCTDGMLSGPPVHSETEDEMLRVVLCLNSTTIC